ACVLFRRVRREDDAADPVRHVVGRTQSGCADARDRSASCGRELGGAAQGDRACGGNRLAGSGESRWRYTQGRARQGERDLNVWVVRSRSAATATSLAAVPCNPARRCAGGGRDDTVRASVSTRQFIVVEMDSPTSL